MSNGTPLDLLLCTVWSTGTPFLTIRLPEAVAEAQHQPSSFTFCIVLLRSLVLNWGFHLPTILVYFWSCKKMWSLALRYPARPIMVSVLSTSFVTISTAAAAMLALVPVALTQKESWLSWLPCVLVTALALFLLHPRSRCKQGQAQFDAADQDIHGPGSRHGRDQASGDKAESGANSFRSVPSPQLPRASEAARAEEEDLGIQDDQLVVVYF